MCSSKIKATGISSYLRPQLTVGFAGNGKSSPSYSAPQHRGDLAEPLETAARLVEYFDPMSMPKEMAILRSEC